MKRKPSPGRATPVPDTVACPLPHERDQVPEAPGEPRREIQLAEKDLRKGRVDTDNYTRAREVAEVAARKRR